ncbi:MULTISPECIES: 2-oxo-tetronate isomerase [Rhodomicrobium]|uniref:2-oxo-tetronate isomerase n=1 Tax=Rhodomicrobium TaxID=1068 RepID=UPI000B4BA35F|nr:MULTISPECIES: 2-oxo-tetronate isomerase [Rhodomicrobium]
MPRFAANLSMMFTELPFPDRFKAAADAGFTAVEYLFPYEWDAGLVGKLLADNGLTQALFNAPPGDWQKGERGMAAIPGREAEFRDSIDLALRYAEATGVRRIHVMAGLTEVNDATKATFRDAVAYAAERFAPQGIDVMLEPINGRNMPGYFLNDFARAAALIEDLGRPNVRLQFDIYHRQIMHGDVVKALQALLPITGHVQVASVPSRHEPDDEELNYPFLFAELDRLGYDGFVGCEYNPRGKTTDGLGWFAPYAKAR